MSLVKNSFQIKMNMFNKNKIYEINMYTPDRYVTQHHEYVFKTLAINSINIRNKSNK